MVARQLAGFRPERSSDFSNSKHAYAKRQLAARGSLLCARLLSNLCQQRPRLPNLRKLGRRRKAFERGRKYGVRLRGRPVD